MKKLIRLLCITISILMLFVMPISATEGSTYSNLFISSYDSFITNPGGNMLRIWFDVVGNGAMDKIGVECIELDRSSDGVNWTTIRSFWPEDHPQMIRENTGITYDFISYAVSYGYYYRAYVVFYAEDSRGFGNEYDYSETIYIPIP